MRSEALQSDDLAKDDFEDMILLQKKTKEDPYINKVIHPFGVYCHSKQQYEVLETIHKRNKKKKEEVVGFLDATGNVVKVTNEKHPIYYYPLVVKLKSHVGNENATIFPLTESLNSRHAVPDIAGWLFNFNESFIHHNSKINPLLNRIVSDFAYANFHGVLHAFHGMRIQQYIFLCYKYACGLSDFSSLALLVKIQMCSIHLANTFAQFVKKYILSDGTISTYEQKYIIEVLCALMTCKSYNLFKEIFRNLCIITLSPLATEIVQTSKDNLKILTATDKLMTMASDLKTNYRYDKLLQENDINDMSNSDTAYELSASILDIIIYSFLNSLWSSGNATCCIHMQNCYISIFYHFQQNFYLVFSRLNDENGFLPIRRIETTAFGTLFFTSCSCASFIFDKSSISSLRVEKFRS